ncbi:DUF1525 domain-containing protein [Zhongshania marina]|uniref:TIGR03757 family integrating conjugative element protein n=1 Tax=Zhongshania marina TaxID=2304603 RepID=A0A2S4HC40_9GAMM|nr:DUF1525 domain-containing protein [Marortus luteolus]POP51555.1 hypothetical protein C0068_16600 [Marortus luteolus]
MRIVLLLMISLVSLDGVAGSVAIYTNDANPVQLDIDLPGDIVLPIQNLDAITHAKAELNTAVSELVKREPPGPAPKRYKKAFFELLNSPAWRSHEEALEKGNGIIINAVQQRVEKIPAIIFDGKYVVYGVTSLKEAVGIYSREVNR